MRKEWRSTEPNPAKAVLIPNEHRTAHGIMVGETYFTHRELREFGQWLIAQADELEPAPKNTPKPAPKFNVGDRVMVISLDFKDRGDIPDSILGQCGKLHSISGRIPASHAVYFGRALWWFPPKALELVSDKPEKPEKRFYFRAANRDLLTRDDARKQMEDFTKSDGVARVLLEVVATCTAVEKKTVEVEWS